NIASKVSSSMRPSNERGSQRRGLTNIASLQADRGRQLIAAATHGANQPRWLVGIAQALTQTADGHVDDALQRHHLAATGGVADGVAVENLLRVVEKQLEQGEVGAGQNHLLAVAVE